jgi:hypothetical protein
MEAGSRAAEVPKILRVLQLQAWVKTALVLVHFAMLLCFWK